jgi:DegV family protein with EDD domain
MNDTDIRKAMVTGVERLTAWSELLDRINVFPVADGDTGRNLVVSLAPLRRTDGEPKILAHELLFSARGNAGNIAARFFHAFLQGAPPAELAATIQRGRDQAWQAVADPQPGTMLTFFDELVGIVRRDPPVQADRAWVRRVMDHLTTVVAATTDRQVRLKEAGVVDSGALGMFLFFDGFWNALAGHDNEFCDVAVLFSDRLHVDSHVHADPESGYCVDMVLSHDESADQKIAAIAHSGESVVVIRDGDYVKVHLHTPDREQTRRRIETVSHVLQWSDDDLLAQTAAFQNPHTRQALHVMTDAAGSLSREHARSLDITLLDSYILMGEKALPESCLTPAILYDAMKKGRPVSTSQASIFERRQSYQSVVSLYGKALYLCVGSFYTGNHNAAVQWKTKHDPHNGLTVMDTGCAAGRLGLLAMVTARFAGQTENPDEVTAFAREAVHRCHEYIFLDRLQYLAAGGRMSKTGAFFGDMMQMKPVISPQPDGARKVGLVRNRRDQKAFAVKKLAAGLKPESRSVIWLEYTDNSDWIEDELRPEIESRYPAAEILIKPLSLTTGVHTGPGSWAVAFLADQ